MMDSCGMEFDEYVSCVRLSWSLSGVLQACTPVLGQVCWSVLLRTCAWLGTHFVSKSVHAVMLVIVHLQERNDAGVACAMSTE